MPFSNRSCRQISPMCRLSWSPSLLLSKPRTSWFACFPFSFLLFGESTTILTPNQQTDQKNLNTRMSAIKHKILILSGKGGLCKKKKKKGLTQPPMTKRCWQVHSRDPTRHFIGSEWKGSGSVGCRSLWSIYPSPPQSRRITSRQLSLWLDPSKVC